jgi:glyoxylase-like metal-dependent hydrolase (beta-lactamase superfamily II)
MRVLMLAGMASLGLIVGGPAQAQGDSGPLPMFHLIARNVYMLEGKFNGHFHGGNVTVLVGDDGLLLVDAQVFADAQHVGATIIARDTVRKRMHEKKCDQPTALPTLTFSSELALHFDDEDVKIIKLPTGHTDGDAIVYIEKAHVASTGDAFVSNGLPQYSKYAGGNMLGMNEQLHKIAALLPEDVKIVPGHGPLASLSDVRRASKALDEIRDAVTAQLAKGKTLTQIQAMNLLQPWKDLVEGTDGAIYVKYYFDWLTAYPDPKFQL